MFECVHSTISFTYAQKWIVIEMAPVIVAGFLLLGVFVSNVAESLRKRVRLCVVIAKTGDMLVGGIFTVSAHGLAAHGLPSLIHPGLCPRQKNLPFSLGRAMKAELPSLNKDDGAWRTGGAVKRNQHNSR